jgi:hypothetical protein
MFILTHTVNFPYARKPEGLENTYYTTFGRALVESFDSSRGI